MPPQLTPEQRQAFADALHAGRKIEAIKQLRELSGLGLKEAKEIIDRLEAELRAAQPERFAKSAKGQTGCALLLMIFLLVDAVILFFIFR